MNSCKVIEDLLPLYEENLVHQETKIWIEQHLASCSQCKQLTALNFENIPKIAPPKKSANTMIHNAQLKLTIYQLLFVLLSFAFAISTSLLNESFVFILSYFLLGAVMFYFYQQAILTILVSFIPTFIWSVYVTIDSYGSYAAWYSEQMTYYSSSFSLLMQTLFGSALMAFIHTIFTVLGIIVVKLLISAFKKEQSA